MILTNLSQHYLTLGSFYQRKGFSSIVKLQSALSLYEVAFTFTGVIHHFNKIESPSLNIALCFIDKNQLSGSRKEVYNVKSLQTV